MPTDFLWAAGTSNSGLVTTAITLMSTELKSLASAAGIVSSVGGSTGVFNNLNMAQAMWADLFYYPGNAGCTPTGSASLSGWFLTSPDGTTFESTTVVPARSPDFIIPLPAAAIGGANAIVYRSVGMVRVPALPFYTFVQNNANVALGAGATTSPSLKLAPYAVQY